MFYEQRLILLPRASRDVIMLSFYYLRLKIDWRRETSHYFHYNLYIMTACILELPNSVHLATSRNNLFHHPLLVDETI